MAVNIVVGTLWGDEGKGKITDYLATNASAVVRWSGGNNAGHTVKVGEKTYKLHLMPSGILRKGVYAIVGSGCVINPQSFIEELKYIKNHGFSDDHVVISDRAHVILPYHLLLDEYQEQSKNQQAIGTTKKGIGPAYADKYQRIGIRVADFIEPEVLKEKLYKTIKFYNNLFTKLYNKPILSFAKVYQNALHQAQLIKKYVQNSSDLINKLASQGKNIVFEGAQGALLDVDYGTYPYVTSSNPVASSAPVGSGINLKYIDKIYGVTKAYCSRVGNGPFPTILKDDLGKYIQKKGNERGTTTNRLRDVGWLDLVALKHSIKNSSVTDIALTLLDVLTSIKELKLCVSYKIGEKLGITSFPAISKKLAKAIPQYITLPGWDQDISQVKTFEELPHNAQNYINTIEKLTSTKVSIFSVGPKRTQTVFRKDKN